MTITKIALAAAMGLALTHSASAQTPAAQPAAPPAPAAATPAAPATYSDEDVKKYATALLAVNKIQADASVAAADKPAKFGEAVVAAGIDTAKFNEMSQAMKASPELNTRIQTAAAAQTPSATAGTQ